MRKLLLAALVALPLLIIATLPAGLVVPRFDPPPALGQYGGTLWSGHARWSQVGQVPMTLNWQWGWGRQWNWEAFDSESRLTGRWQPGQGIHLSEVEGALAIDRLDLATWLPLSPPEGRILLDLDSVRLRPGRAPRIKGVAIWDDARLSGMVEASLGRVELRFETPDSASGDLQSAQVRSLDAAQIMVRGTIDMDQASYRADLWLRASPDRPDLAAQLGNLGARQSDGQVRIQLQGALGLGSD